MENVSFYCPPMLDFTAALKSTLCLIWKNILIKSTWLYFPFKYRCWLLTALNCWGLFSSRWKYGSRINAPNTKKSWNMAADQKSISTAPAPSPPAHLRCPNFGKSQWLTKEATCTQTVTWTVLATGIQTTLLTRTPCPGLRCECFTFDSTQARCSDLQRLTLNPPLHHPPTSTPSKGFIKRLCMSEFQHKDVTSLDRLWCHLNIRPRLTKKWTLRVRALTFYQDLFCALLSFIAKLILVRHFQIKGCRFDVLYFLFYCYYFLYGNILKGKQTGVSFDLSSKCNWKLKTQLWQQIPHYLWTTSSLYLDYSF